MKNLKIFEHYSDMDVIHHILNGDTDLFEILIRRNNSFLHKTGRSYGYSHDDTQDLMQETFINAYVNLQKFENRCTFKTWIIKIMLNNCFQKQQRFNFKNEIRDTQLINEKSVPMYSTYKNSETGKVVVNQELNDLIERSLALVPMEYRMVFSLREINGLNVAETAEALNITPSNVKVRLNRAKSMLRKELGKIFTPEDIFEFNLVFCDIMVSRVLQEIAILK
ncbi:MAG: sigma-70 family RNA polymerase sigma factor [Chitinophagales bacterium]